MKKAEIEPKEKDTVYICDRCHKEVESVKTINGWDYYCKKCFSELRRK